MQVTGILTLLALLLIPISALGKPFSVIAPERLEICSSAPSISTSEGLVSSPQGVKSSGFGWIVVGGEPFGVEDLRRIEVAHWSSHPEIQVQSELVIDQRGAAGLPLFWEGFLRPGTATGDGDLVALAAFPGIRDGKSAWVWSWRWPQGYHATERVSTSVRLGAYDARFETVVVFNRECDHRPKSTAAQLATATSASPPVAPMIAEIRRDPPERELRDNRRQLQALGLNESRLSYLELFDQSITTAFDPLTVWHSVSVEIEPNVEHRLVRFAHDDPAPYLYLLLLLAHQESLRFEARDDTLFVFDAAEP